MKQIISLLLVVALTLSFALCNIGASAQEDSDAEKRQELSGYLEEEARDGVDTSLYTLYSIAVLYRYFGDHAAALTYIDRVIERDPALALPYALKGLIEFELHDYEAAYYTFYTYYQGTYGEAINGRLSAELMEGLLVTLLHLGIIRGSYLDEEPTAGGEYDARAWLVGIMTLMHDGYITFEEYPSIISRMYIEMANLEIDKVSFPAAERRLDELDALWSEYPEYDHTEHLSSYQEITAQIEEEAAQKTPLDKLFDLFESLSPYDYWCLLLSVLSGLAQSVPGLGH